MDALDDAVNSVTRAYCRCNSGHYFQGEFCPFDGWSSKASKELAQAVARLARTGRALSMAALRKAGLSQATLERTVLIEFGKAETAFEALAPRSLVVNDQVKTVGASEALPA